MIATENGTDEMRLAKVTKTAMTWPSFRDLREKYGVTDGFIRGAVDSGQVRAVRLDRIRVNPRDWERFLTERLSGA